MKLTKQKLKQIIKEELTKILKEGACSRPCCSADGCYGPMKSKQLYKDARKKIKNLGPALSPDQIQDLANTDLIALAVYVNLIHEPHPGILSQNIRQAYEQSADSSWEAHKADVQKTLVAMRKKQFGSIS